LLQATEVAEKPNVVFILADDLGWRDTGLTGSAFYETPAIDQLGKEGFHFTTSYAPHPVCGPSRAGIITGKYPLSVGNSGVSGKLEAKETTMAETFKEAGYATFFAGKWHLGEKDKAPANQGFDMVVASNSMGQPGSYYYPYKDRGIAYGDKKRKLIESRDVPGLGDGKEGEYLTDRLTDETVKWIKTHKGEPFFAYLSHYAVHTPIEPKKEHLPHFLEKRSSLPEKSKEAGSALVHEDVGSGHNKLRQDNADYATMVKSFDDSVARIVDTLKEIGEYENTIVVIYSDNGGLSSVNGAKFEVAPGITSNTPLRGGKGWCYEGGIRVPFILSYPAKLKAGTSDAPVMGIDIYPTLLELAELETSSAKEIHGISLVPLTKGETLEKRPLFWYFPRNHGSGTVPSSAVRMGDFKLIHFHKQKRAELYNLNEDPNETKDLSGHMPEKTAGMKKRLDDWVNESWSSSKSKGL
jgi:arylsulfatase A-like enzyme